MPTTAWQLRPRPAAESRTARREARRLHRHGRDDPVAARTYSLVLPSLIAVWSQQWRRSSQSVSASDRRVARSACSGEHRQAPDWLGLGRTDLPAGVVVHAPSDEEAAVKLVNRARRPRARAIPSRRPSPSTVRLEWPGRKSDPGVSTGVSTARSRHSLLTLTVELYGCRSTGRREMKRRLAPP